MNHLSYVPENATLLSGDYNLFLVGVSIIIAIIAAYTALNLISQIYNIKNRLRIVAQIAVSSLVLGIGIWSMHFVGMMAFSLPIPVRYDGILTIYSLLIAVAASLMGLIIVRLKQCVFTRIIGGVCVGLGVSSMHYIGMSAMRLQADMVHDNLLVFISILIGISASLVALWIALEMGKGDISKSFKVKLISAIMMGFAISGMHYTAMAATSFYISEGNIVVEGGFALNPEIIAALLTISFIIIISFTLWVSRLENEAVIIRANEEKIRALTDNILDVIITTKEDGIIDFSNSTVEQIFGYESGEIIGKNIKVLMPNPYKNEHDNFISNYLKKGAGDLIGVGQKEFKGRKKDGSIFPIDVSVSEAYIKGERFFIGVIRDITESVKAKERLYYLAHHDILTSLPNRFSFMEFLEQALIHAKRRNIIIAVLFIDLDRFKVINDSLGHDVGDELLKLISICFKECVREGDVIARLSGDEFTLLLDDVISRNDIAPIVEKIIKRLSAPFIINGRELFVGASVGISLYPIDGVDTQALMKNADVAMYRAKNEGGNQYRFYSHDMNENNVKKFRIESDLHHALTRQQFVLHYQPQIDIDTGVVSGIEALLRWQHPEDGLIPPVDFISLLEETGLIVPIGEWVIRTACKQNKILQDMGIPPITIAVNVSARQFRESNLLETIESILNETKLDPECLELEITESIFMQHDEFIRETINKLHALGIQLAIDDFGTGYSSLSHLRKLPLHTLKIDQSFIRDLNSDADDAAIVQLIIDMSHSLKLNVIAEGVETEQQLAWLKKRHCGEAQGFLLSRPLEVDQLIKFLKKQSIVKNNL